MYYALEPLVHPGALSGADELIAAANYEGKGSRLYIADVVITNWLMALGSPV